MIDISNEELIPIREVPRRLPRRPSGKRVHVSAVYRWIRRGVRGARLEAITIGGTTYTSAEALQRFGDRNTENDDVPTEPSATKSRQRQIERAAREVESILGNKRTKRPSG